ncbi:hypothetical protein [Streptomyces aquilus]|uniref:hypothetical protein n=1 Tax=Streptomyces aquilus TaxID=2548456 RepID=UPI0036C98156
MWRLRTVVNRVVLGGLGLGLLVVGGGLAATDRAVTPRLPSWWPTAAPGAVLLDRDGLARLRGEGWWTPTAVAVAAVLAVLLAWWALARTGPRPARRLALPLPGGTVRPRALADALSLRAAALPGVVRCRTRVLPRAGGRLDLVLRVRLETGARPDAVLPGLRALATEAERSVAPGATRTRIRLTADSYRIPHVR